MEPFSIKWYLRVLYTNNALFVHKAGHLHDYIIGIDVINPEYVIKEVSRRYQLSQYIIERIQRKL